MMRCDQVEARISLHIDGLLDTREETALEAHLADCPSCRAVLADLEQLTATARALGPIEPPDTVWPRLALRLEASDARQDTGRARRPSRFWQAVAAALLVIAAGAAWLVSRAPVDAPVASSPATGSIEAIVDELELASHHYERAIVELQVLAPVGAGIDPQLASVVTDSIALLDEAIDESRRALASDPADESARLSLFEALRRKVDLLQATVLLIDDVRQPDGDDPGRTEAPDNSGREL